MSRMNTIKLNEIEKIVKKNKFAFVSLADRNGTQIVPYNNQARPLADRLNEIKNLADSLPDDYYVLRAKHYNNRNAHVHEFIVQIREPEKSENGHVQIIHVPVKENNVPLADVRTYQEALADKQKIAELENTVQRLQDRINELEDLMDDDTALAEPSMGGLQEVVAPFMPLIEKYLEIQEKKVNLQQQQLQPLRMQQQRKDPMQALVEQWVNYLNTLEDEQFHAKLEEMKQANPELYNIVYPIVWDETAAEDPA